MDPAIRLLCSLVSLPSVNPMGRGSHGDGVYEGRVTDYLENWFRDLGVRYERRTVAPGRDNILAWYDAPRSTRRILFDVHQDTVPADGMTIDPFRPDIRDGRLYGRGACDVKGGMAAMLTAFERLVRERPRGSASVLMACTVDEEYTHMGSSRLANEDLGVDLAIVAEPTELQIVDRHKGAVRWQVRTKGVACHSSNPRLGANAIYRMGKVLEVLSEHADALLDSPPDPILGPPSLSVGRIEGGVSANVVPDLCLVDIDRRMIPGEVAQTCMDDVRRQVEGHLGRVDWVEFCPPWVTMPSLFPDESAMAKWLDFLKPAIAEIAGHAPKVVGVPYGTDAGPLGESGLPCIVFGPGHIAQAHTKDEWIEIEQVLLGSEMYYSMVNAVGETD